MEDILILLLPLGPPLVCVTGVMARYLWVTWTFRRARKQNGGQSSEFRGGGHQASDRNY
jgi:hypothetical protein